MIPSFNYWDYHNRVSLLFDQGVEEEEKDSDGNIIRTYCTMTDEGIDANIRMGLRLVSEHIERKEYRELSALGEYMRAKAHFSCYFDHQYTPELSKTFELLLRHAHYIIDSGGVFEDIYILRVAEAIYDIVFHHIAFEDGHFDPVCEQLYHQLSEKLLDKQFRRRLKAKRKEINYHQYGLRDGYEECYYFINFGTADEDYVPHYMKEDEDIPE